MLNTLVTRLAALPAVDALTRACATPRGDTPATPVRVAALLTAARPVVVAALAERLADYARHNLIHEAQALLYVPGPHDAALLACEDLHQWLPPEQVCFYPATLPPSYQYTRPDMTLLPARLHTLQRLATLRQHSSDADTPAPPPLVIVASLSALLQPTLTPDDLAYATTHVTINTWLPQDKLLRRWIESGYRTTTMVQEAGEIARRGGIVDIWPPADTHPLRIEWFGDEIDSLRRFDPQTQRSEQRIESATISPALEIAYWQRERVLHDLHELDITTLRQEVREEWENSIALLETGGRLEGWATLLPLFHQPPPQQHNQRPGLLAHLPAHSTMLLSDMPRLRESAAALHEQAEEQRQTLIESGELPAHFPRPYLLWDELFYQHTPPAPPLVVDMSSTPTDDPAEPDDPTEPDDPAPPAPTHTIPAPDFTAADLFGGQLRRVVDDIVTRLHGEEQVIIVSTHAARLQELVAEATRTTRSPHQNITFLYGTLSEGWHLACSGITLYTDTELFGLRHRRPPRRIQHHPKEQDSDERETFLRGLKPGEYVVHIEHGIGLYEGMVRRAVNGIEREYLNLRYASGERLYIPVDQIDRVARYVGAGDSSPRLTRLGTQEWVQAKRKARAAVQELANDLLALYAQRKLSQGHPYPSDNQWQRDLESAFPYIETDDQIRVLHDVKSDMESSHPMDRLICGDVGFGKTEIALRAAFKAVQDSKQVAILVPTTVLAQQHHETFTHRMDTFPVIVEMLSRFRTQKEQTGIIKRLAAGSIDILIGTHRLLSDDVRFKNLGLLIIDEEQRFGVRHKERLKQLRTEVDVLTLTATPIPRTLHMALAGIRDMSVIETPPEYRMPIKTYVVPYNKNLIRTTIRRELDRGGQVYFVHNRVQSIERVVERLRKLVPEATIGVGHGQMDERQLEKVMLEFFRGTYDILVCTTIIENGLDVPNANTIIIDDAPNYGLAQLYQLRGRVGRSTRRAYAYLLYREQGTMTRDAAQRLQAIQEATELGAGFRIAMRDLEIRGAGNLLGSEQSGYIAAVGYDLYARLLEQAVKQIKRDHSGPAPGHTSPAPTQGRNGGEERGAAHPPLVVDEHVLVNPLVTLTLPLSAYLPEDYIPEGTMRLDVYQRIVTARTPHAVQMLRRELRDRFGELPEPAANLLTWLHIKALALSAGVNAITTTDDEYLIRLPESAAARNRVQRRFGRDRSISIGKQFIRLNRRHLASAWVERLIAVLETLQNPPDS